MLLAAVIVEELTHPGLGVGCVLDAPALVDLPDRAEVVGHQRLELHVDDAVGRDAAVLTRGDRPVERVEDHFRPQRCDIGDRDVVAEDPPEVREERGQRGDDLDGVAVRLDVARVGVLGLEGREGPEVRARLHDPPVAAVVPPEELQVAPVQPVRRRHVRLRGHPAHVRREVVLAPEDHALEVATRDAHALLREPRAGRVHRLHLGSRRVTEVDARLHVVDARVGVVRRRLGWRDRAVDLPAQRHAIRRVLAEEIVQDRRAGATHADHHDDRPDVGARDVGVLVVPVHDLEPVREVADQVVGCDRDAELAEPCLGMQPVDEEVEAFAVRTRRRGRGAPPARTRPRRARPRRSPARRASRRRSWRRSVRHPAYDHGVGGPG